MKFRKKPVVIEAFHLTEETRKSNSNWPDWMHKAWQKEVTEEGCVSAGNGSRLLIHTKVGVMQASVGDYIIQGVSGELYPCKPDIFEKTYEPVEE